MVEEQEFHWFAQATKISMEDSATRNVKLATLALAQCVGSNVPVIPLMPELHALRNRMAELLECQ